MQHTHCAAGHPVETDMAYCPTCGATTAAGRVAASASELQSRQQSNRQQRPAPPRYLAAALAVLVLASTVVALVFSGRAVSARGDAFSAQYGLRSIYSAEAPPAGKDIRFCDQVDPLTGVTPPDVCSRLEQEVINDAEREQSANSVASAAKAIAILALTAFVFTLVWHRSYRRAAAAQSAHLQQPSPSAGL